MKKLLIVLLLVVIAAGTWWIFFKEKKQAGGDEKVGPIVTQMHSPGFNAGIDSLLTAYFNMKDAFVTADTAGAKAAANTLIQLADSNRLEELKADSEGIYESALMLLGDVKSNTESLINQTAVTEMRQDFRMVSESLYPLLKTIHYEGETLYLQHCPMAFGENNGANWVSNTKEIINPYLGSNHPVHKATMLHCGEVKDSIQAK